MRSIKRCAVEPESISKSSMTNQMQMMFQPSSLKLAESEDLSIGLDSLQEAPRREKNAVFKKKAKKEASRGLH